MRRDMLRPDMLRATTFATAALILVGLSSIPTSAQIFAGTEVKPVAAIPSDVDMPKKPPEVLHFLPTTLDGMRITGETGDLRWPVYLTAKQAADPLRFRIGYVSTVSILPDTSSLVVRINDREIGTDVIDAPRGLRTVEYAVLPGLAHEGYNAITVSVRERHRVDCSVQATYELWTKIDPNATGLVLPAASRNIESIADIAALLPKADGSFPIHILLAGKTNPAHLQRLIKATEAIALAGQMLQPIVDFDGSSADIHGIDIAVGTRAAIVGIPQIGGSIEASGPLIKILPAGDAGRPILVVTGSNDTEVDQAIAALADVGSTKGSPPGLVAARNYPAFKTEGGETLSLRDLGVHSEEFSGRFFRKSFGIMLPADFLSSDYGRGTFDLAGGYAAGLAHGAQVSVDVNGKSSGIIKLPYAAGDVFRHNQLFLPLGLMRPGLNRIDIFAETPKPEDATCAADDAKRFLFLDTSSLVLPVLARVQRLPDLALVATGALPYTQGHARLIVPKPDRDTMGSALSLTARAAVAAGRIISFEFSTAMPKNDDGSMLVVSPARALDPAIMTAIGLDPARVEAAWRDRAAPQSSGVHSHWWLTNSDGPAACRMPSFAKIMTPEAPVSRPVPMSVATEPKAESEDLLDTWSGDQGSRTNWLDRLKTMSTGVEDWIGAIPRSIYTHLGRGAQEDGVNSGASLILAQGMSHGSSENVTTIVTAPNSAMLHAAMACLLDPQVWSNVHGRLAVLDASSGKVTATDATSFHYVSGAHMSLANSRLVLAGWFSLDPVAFVAVAMLMALCMSGTTLWFVRSVGRKSE